MNEAFESEGGKCQVGETEQTKHGCSGVAEHEGRLEHNHVDVATGINIGVFVEAAVVDV